MPAAASPGRSPARHEGRFREGSGKVQAGRSPGRHEPEAGRHSVLRRMWDALAASDGLLLPGVTLPASCPRPWLDKELEALEPNLDGETFPETSPGRREARPIPGNEWRPVDYDSLEWQGMREKWERAFDEYDGRPPAVLALASDGGRFPTGTKSHSEGAPNLMRPNSTRSSAKREGVS